MRLLSLSEATSIVNNIVYALVDDDGIFYVGKTINPSKRFATYKNKECHNNKGLAERLNPELCKVVILSDDCKDERLFIDLYKDQIVNIIGVKCDFEHHPKPWFAGSGIRCPSDFLIWHTLMVQGKDKRHLFNEVEYIRSKMSVTERCVYEVSIYKDMKKPHQDKLSRWFETCLYKMLKEMESGYQENTNPKAERPA